MCIQFFLPAGGVIHGLSRFFYELRQKHDEMVFELQIDLPQNIIIFLQNRTSKNAKYNKVHEHEPHQM